jgi:hypothetical protein
MRISRENSRLAVSTWSLLKDSNELPPGWDIPGAKGDGALQMVRDIGKPGHKNRTLKKHRPAEPHGPDNSYWGADTLISRDPRYQKIQHAWETMKSKDAGFRRVFYDFGMFLRVVGDSYPEHNARRERLSFEKKDAEAPWGPANVRFLLIDKEAERTTKEKDALARQRAYSAWRRTPMGLWPSYHKFVQEVGYPPRDGRWSLAPRNKARTLAPGNAAWVCVDSDRVRVPLLVLNEKHCLVIARRIKSLNPRITQAEAWEIATMLRNSRFIDGEYDVAAENEKAPAPTAPAPDSSSEQGQAPPQAHQGAGAAASPCSLPLVQDNATLAAALSFLSNACGTTDDSVRTATRYILDREEGKGLDPVFLPVLTTYRTAIRAARGIA